jgi:ppGpp synthetase/RelA/SpoT-type nucleotidyltranferase
MKIIKQLRDLYQASSIKYERLAVEVRETLKPRVEVASWFFLSRLKDLESFALKVETGRVPDPHSMEDFYACTIVVPTILQIDDAEQLVRSLYDFHERRPAADTTTRKASSSFAFDDLRLYVNRRPLASGKDAELDGLIFEVQVKTILQHAWSTATHDLIYKTDTVSWPRERIAYQVKAMLEHAEVAIAEANRISDARAVAKKDDRTDNILRIIEQVESFWPEDRLPENVKRLAETIFELLRACDLSAYDLDPLLKAEKRRVGLVPTDLSPYSFVVQAMAQSHNIDFRHKFNRNHIRSRIVIHSGMDLPKWMDDAHSRIVKLD